MPTYPFVLAHGIARFDFFRKNFIDGLGLPPERIGDRTHYFRNIRSHLKAKYRVHHSDVDFAGSLEKRATDLKAQVEQVLDVEKAKKVHIIAHSMGGLDARYIIVKLGMHDRVCSLTTIGTPHWGSSFADWGAERRGEKIVGRLHDVVDLDGLLDLRSSACAAFNKDAQASEADNDVYYQTYAAWEEDEKRVLGLLQGPWKVISQSEKGYNDGLVSVESQRWTKTLKGKREKTVAQHDFPVLADHLNEVGWWDPRQLSGKLRLSAFANPLVFFRSLFNDRREYENQVKGAYLSIAQDLERRFPVV